MVKQEKRENMIHGELRHGMIGEKGMRNEFEKNRHDILTLTETIKRGQGEILLPNRPTQPSFHIYSGVKQENRTAGRVRCLINSNIATNIRKCEGHSERILMKEFILNREICTGTTLTVYEPNEDVTTENTNEFWEPFNLITENSRGNIYVLQEILIVEKEMNLIVTNTFYTLNLVLLVVTHLKRWRARVNCLIP